MQKVVYRWVPHNLTKQQKEECVRISKETIRLLNDGGHRIISKIVMGEIPFLTFQHVKKESMVFDNPKTTMVER
ncbi:hypothetical protein TNCV_3125731 [Trichonephila clavipes]|nr:hypothetical protein TNCV_3125731 [Trichonephila clavipes]